MSPKSFVVLLLVALCASQVVSKSRQARGVSELVSAAQSKLSQLLGKSEDAIRTSAEFVAKQVGVLEAKVLNFGTNFLADRNINLNLTDVASLLKSNARICAKDEDIRSEASSILNNVKSCVTKDVESVKGMLNSVKRLWRTATDLPNIVRKVSGQCKAHVQDDVSGDALTEFLDDSDHDLAEKSNELLKAASHHISKRDLWGLGRVTDCIKSVYNMAKGDLVVIPGQIMSKTADALRVVQLAPSGIATCVGTNIAQQSPAIVKLSLKVGSCVASGVTADKNLDGVIAGNPTLSAIKQLSAVADQIQNLRDSPVINAASSAARMLG